MAKQQHQTRPRPRAGDIAPINGNRIPCSDGPPPDVREGEVEPVFRSVWRNYPDKKTPPAVKPMAPKSVKP